MTMAHASVLLFCVLAAVVAAAAAFEHPTDDSRSEGQDSIPLTSIFQKLPDYGLSSNQFLLLLTQRILMAPSFRYSHYDFTSLMYHHKDFYHPVSSVGEELKKLKPPPTQFETYHTAITMFYGWHFVSGKLKKKVERLHYIVKAFPLVGLLIPLIDRGLLLMLAKGTKSSWKVEFRYHRERRVNRLLKMLKDDKELSKVASDFSYVAPNIQLPEQVDADISRVLPLMPVPKGAFPPNAFSPDDEFVRNGQLAKELFEQSTYLKSNPQVDTFMRLALRGIRIPYDLFLKDVQLSNGDVTGFLPFLNMTDCEHIFLHEIQKDRLLQVVNSPVFLMRAALAPQTVLSSFMVVPTKYVNMPKGWNPHFLDVLDTPQFQPLAEILLPVARKESPLLFVLLFRDGIDMSGKIAGKPILPEKGVLPVQLPDPVYLEEFNRRLEHVPHHYHKQKKTALIYLDCATLRARKPQLLPSLEELHSVHIRQRRSEMIRRPFKAVAFSAFILLQVFDRAVSRVMRTLMPPISYVVRQAWACVNLAFAVAALIACCPCYTGVCVAESV